MAGQYDEDDYRDFESREAGDKNVYVKFYTRPVRNEQESDKQGRAVFEDKEYIEIRTPGNATNIVQRPVTEMDRARFRKQYRAFKEDREQMPAGTPLREVSWITASQVEELNFLRVMTLEMLADVNDDVCQRMPGLFKLRERAKKFVEQAAGAAPLLAMQAQLEEMRNQMEVQRRTIEEQSAIIKSLNEKK